jgi:hypothetical protein
MDETIELVTSILSFSFFAFIVTALAGFTLFCFADKNDILSKYFRAVMPMYYMFLAIMLLCTLLLLAFKSFRVTLIEIAALIAWICALSSAVATYKLGKKNSEKFKSFALKKYALDILLCFIVYLLWAGGIF